VENTFPQVMLLVGAGFVGGLILFGRGLVAYRRDRLIEAMATSSLDAIAAGEVRVSGTVEAIAMTLVSPIQSRPCVWYRARVDQTGETSRLLLNEERAQEFDLLDGTGRIRVVPRGARWEIAPAFDGSTGLTGDEPPGLRLRTGSSFAAIAQVDPASMSRLERDAAIQELLTVKAPTGARDAEASFSGSGDGGGIAGGSSGKRYRESRLEPGQTITVIGQALPWSDVRETSPATSPRPARPGSWSTARSRRGATRRSRASGSAVRPRCRRSIPGRRHLRSSSRTASRAQRTDT
jgi:hypothetical protein